MQRIGRKHEPAFRLVLTDSKNSTKSGKFNEILGNYDARRGEKAELKAERITYWMSQGAKASDTVHNLLIDKKIITGKKINTLPKKSAPKPEPVVEAAAPAPVGHTPVAEAPEAVVEAPVAEVAPEAPAEAPVETPAPAPEEIPAPTEEPATEATA